MLHDDDLLKTGKRIVFYGVGKYAREFTRRHCGACYGESLEMQRSRGIA